MLTMQLNLILSYGKGHGPINHLNSFKIKKKI